MPLETICGVGRASNRDAEVTPASLGIADKRWQTSVDQAGAAIATKRPGAAVETSGIDDMETSGFQGTSGRNRLWGGYQYSPFVRFNCCPAGRRLSSILKLFATQDS